MSAGIGQCDTVQPNRKFCDRCCLSYGLAGYHSTFLIRDGKTTNLHLRCKDATLRGLFVGWAGLLLLLGDLKKQPDNIRRTI